MCLPHGLETRLIKPFSAEPDFRVGQNYREFIKAPGNGELTPGGEWDGRELSGAGKHTFLREMLPFVK